MANIDNFTNKQMELMTAGTAVPMSYYPNYFDGHFITFDLYDKDDRYITTFNSTELDFDVIFSPKLPETTDELYQNEADGQLYKLLINPNEALNRIEELRAVTLQSGKYKLKFNFYRNMYSTPVPSSGRTQYTHIVDEISNSRKELRCTLKPFLTEDVDAAVPFVAPIIADYASSIGVQDADCIQFQTWESMTTLQKLSLIEAQNYKCMNFNWVLKSEQYPDESFTIVNWEIDNITDPDLPTIVFRFDKPLPGLIKRLDTVDLFEEIFPTQIENIVFIKQDVISTGMNSLTPDTTFTPTVNAGDTSMYQSYNELSSSLQNGNLIDQVISSSAENLNINYNEFENHTFFGSAAIKLENFRRKIGNLQGHWNTLSSSLSNSGSAESLKLMRSNAFSEINNIVNTFTAYEKFLYEDYQNETTASAPGLGKNLIKKVPLLTFEEDNLVQNNLKLLGNYENLPTVYQISSSGDDRTPVHLFTKKYVTENPPFFNSTGSYYLSFWVKNDTGITGSTNIITQNWNNFYGYSDYDNIGASIRDNYGLDGITEPNKFSLPRQAGHASATGSWVSNSISSSVTGSNWRQIILVSSQSNWRPEQEAPYDADAGNIMNWTNEDGYEVLSGSNVSASFHQDGFAYGVKDSSGHYGYLLSPTSMSADGLVVSTDAYRTGSILPSGPLFTSFYKPNGERAELSLETSQSMLITDVKLTTENPIHSLPFASLYPTGSQQFDSWYTSISSSAVIYDDNNIHSFKNNLPKFYKESGTAEELRKFLDLWGEHFDLVRNYIDNFKNFYKRSYSEYDSIPNNLMPILADNLGWELIQPFSSSLSETFEAYASTGGDSEKEIIFNTWKKTINNLMYIYKSKGTKNSLDGLLNTYGYPSQYINLLNEYGSSDETATPVVFSGTAPNEIDVNNPSQTLGQGGRPVSLRNERKENYSYVLQTDILKGINLTNDEYGEPVKRLELDWQTDSLTKEIDCIEFIFKHQGGTNNQVLIQSTGSFGLLATPTQPWLLQLTSDDKLEFRVSGDGNYQSSQNSALSMSLSLTSSADKLWNVMITRDASNTAGSNPQKYKLYAGLQDGDTISQFHFTSMSVSKSMAVEGWEMPQDGGTTYPAGTGAFLYGQYGHYKSGSNLHFGHSLSGSMSEIRGWAGELSSSVFKKHILNKKDNTGNSINSWRDDLIWHYKLDEDPGSGSGDFTIINSSTKDSRTIENTALGRSDFNRPVSASLWRYTETPIVSYKLQVTQNAANVKTDNNIIIAKDIRYIKKLNPISKSTLPTFDKRLKNKKPVAKLSMTKSPIDSIDNYITDIMSGHQIKDQIQPSDLYEPKYTKLKTLQKEVIQDRGVKTDVPKYMRANRKMFNPIIIGSVKKVLPARSNIDNSIGFNFRQSLLSKAKYKYTKPSVEDASGPSGSINLIDENIDLKSSYINTYDSNNIIMPQSLNTSFLDTYNVTLFDNSSKLFSLSSSYITTKDSTINLSQNIQTTYETPKNVVLDLLPPITGTKIGLYEDNLGLQPTVSSNYNSSYNTEITDMITETAEYNKTNDAEIFIQKDLTSQFEKIHSDTLDLSQVISSSFIDTNDSEIDLLQSINSSFDGTNDAEIEINQEISSIYDSMKQDTITITQDISSLYNSTKNGDISIIQSLTPSYESTKEDTITITQDISSEYSSILEDSLITLPSLSQEYCSVYEDTINVDVSELSSSLVRMVGEFKDIYSDTIDGGSAMNGTNPGIQGSYQTYLEVENLELRDAHTRSWESINPVAKWGRTYDDVHFIYDWAEVNLGYGDNPTTGSDAFGNVYYRESRWYFTDIGDKTWLSASLSNQNTMHWDSTDWTKHKNITFTDVGKGYTYQSYMGDSGNFEKDGRPIGKTSYMSASNVPYSGSFHKPVNHISNFADNGNVWRYKYAGSQLQDYYNLWHPLDLSTASFYTVEVAQRRSMTVDNRGRKRRSR